MKKIFTFIILLSLIACNKNTSVQEIYNDYYKLIKYKQNFDSNENLPFTITLNINEGSIKKYHYEFIFENPNVFLNDLKIAILPINFKNDEIIPTFNILEKVDFQKFNDKQSKIKINYFSDTKYSDFKILIEYNNQSKLFLIKE